MPEYIVRSAYRGVWSATSQDVVNVFHHLVAQLSSPFDPTAAADAIDARLTPLYKAVWPVGSIIHDLTVTDVTRGELAPKSHVKSIELAGTRAVTDTKLNPGLCNVMRLKTGIAKRYARGHAFLPPILATTQLATDGTTGGQTYSTAAIAFATQFKGGWTAGGTDYAPVVFSRTKWLTPAEDYFFALQDAVADTKVHWLRSRSGLAQ